MKLRKILFLLVLILLILNASFLQASENEIKPANPKISPEALELLKLIHSISGQYTLEGQHNFPNTKDRNSQFAASYIGKNPVVFSTDMGFAPDGDNDLYLARPSILNRRLSFREGIKLPKWFMMNPEVYKKMEKYYLLSNIQIQCGVKEQSR